VGPSRSTPKSRLDQHNFKERLAEITARTLVVAGDKDPFYTETLFRETAAGIPNAGLILSAGMGHPAAGKQFERDTLAFLNECSSDAHPSPEGESSAAPRRV
jgi:pimeloyl-ACP methyl ester carboxylesterase